VRNDQKGTKKGEQRLKTKNTHAFRSKWQCVDHGFWQRISYFIYLCHVYLVFGLPSITMVPRFFQRTDATYQKRCCHCQGHVNRVLSGIRKVSSVYLYIF